MNKKKCNGGGEKKKTYFPELKKKKKKKKKERKFWMWRYFPKRFYFTSQRPWVLSRIWWHVWRSTGEFTCLCDIKRLLLNHAKMPGFLASGGEEFNPGTETKLDRSELLCNKVLLKYKGDRERFWHRHQKGQKEYPLASVSHGVIYTLISYYSESKECLEVVKTSLELLP